MVNTATATTTQLLLAILSQKSLKNTSLLYSPMFSYLPTAIISKSHASSAKSGRTSENSQGARLPAARVKLEAGDSRPDIEEQARERHGSRMRSFTFQIAT